MSEKLIYKQIERELLERIRSGRYLPGAQLPTEHELELEFAVSRMTVSKGMGALVRAGYIERTRGRGTFVRNPLPGRATVTDERLPGMLKYISPPSPDGAGARYSGGSGLLEGLHEAARQTRYSVGIDFFSSLEEQLEILQNYHRPLNDGYIIWPAEDQRVAETLRKLHAEGFPFVLADSFFPELVCDYVINDNAAGARMMIRHLFETGHRNISYLTVPVDRISLSERLAGVLSPFGTGQGELVVRYSIIPDCDKVSASSHSAGAIGFIRQWLDGELARLSPPDAIFCSNDCLALSVCEQLESLGVRVPRDISVAGFDDIKQAAWAAVPLTTVAQNFFEMGRRAGQILLQRLGHPEMTPMPLQYRIAPTLIARASTARHSEPRCTRVQLERASF